MGKLLFRTGQWDLRIFHTTFPDKLTDYRRFLVHGHVTLSVSVRLLHYEITMCRNSHGIVLSCSVKKRLYQYMLTSRVF